MLLRMGKMLTRESCFFLALLGHRWYQILRLNYRSMSRADGNTLLCPILGEKMSTYGERKLQTICQIQPTQLGII